MSTKIASSPQAQPLPQLRPPFKLVANMAGYVAKGVNGTVDGTMGLMSKSANAFLRNSYVEYATNGIKAFEKNVEGKVRPYTQKTQPYVQPLVPYINKATPYIPPALVVLLALSSIPVLFVGGIIAFFTAPIWLTIGFFTAPLWIPLAFFGFLLTGFLTFIAAVRYFSHPNGHAHLQRIWNVITSTQSGKRLFYVNKPTQPSLMSIK